MYIVVGVYCLDFRKVFVAVKGKQWHVWLQLKLFFFFLEIVTHNISVLEMTLVFVSVFCVSCCGLNPAITVL